MIPKYRYWLLMLLIVLVYFAGLFVTLFENDSAQFAVMAMRMVVENDYINLIKGTEEYLDKPHLHYWLAAGSYLIFGIEDWAYRIPAVLSSLLGAYSCYGLGRELYRKEVGRTAALIFLTAQTIVLANIDVRTDSVLTGFTAFSIWQLVAYIRSNSNWNLLLGAIGAGLAFSTKGQIAILVIGLPILCHLYYTGQWKRLFSWKVVIGLLAFAVVISPMLFAYYQQFDLHPEKVIRGQSGRSGILFIFWEQSFERLSGEGVGKNSSDYFFFFHSFLWVFLPWTILGILAFGKRLGQLIKMRFQKVPDMEILTVGGISLIFILISFAQFKLPHYLNITIPLFAVLTASYLWELKANDRLRTNRFLLGSQVFVAVLVIVLSLILCLWVFRFDESGSYVLLGLGVILLLMSVFRKEEVLMRIVTMTAASSIFINAVLNLHFYPELLKYQAGSAMSKIVKNKNIAADNIYKLSGRHSWSLDFYNRTPLGIVEPDQLSTQSDVWLYVTSAERDRLLENGYQWDQQYFVDQFRITRLQAKFLNPKTRDQVLEKMYLLYLD